MKSRGPMWVAIILVFFGCAILAGWFAIPRLIPFYRDDQGVPHGNGVEDAHYSDGALRTRTHFRQGREVMAEWFDRSGNVVMRSQLDADQSGPGIILDDNGIIRLRGTTKKGIFEGQAVRYDEAGNEIGKVFFVGGVESQQ